MSEQLEGKEYGSWRVLYRDTTKKGQGTYFVCRCSCGREASVLGRSLTRMASTQCRRCRDDQNRGGQNGVWSGYGGIPGKYWRSVCRNAATRSLEFGITIEYAWDLFLRQDGRCALSGVPLRFRVGTHSGTASLDRIESVHGYVPGNVQWVHKQVNVMKSDMPDHELVEWCRLIVEVADARETQ